MLGADLPASDPPARPALQRPAELLAGGRPADAAEALQAVVAGAPTYAAAFVLLGVALDAAGRPAEALSAWHRAAFLVPNSPLVLRERRRLLAATATPETEFSEVERVEEPAADLAEAPAVEMPDVNEPAVEAPAVEAPAVEAPAVEAPESAEPERREEPAAEPVEAAAVEAAEPERLAEPEAFDPTTFEARADAAPLDAFPADEAPTAGTVVDDAPDAAALDADAIQTAPLDDFIFADAPPAAADDDDGFDPDGFDFSGFDLGADDDADWLAEPADGPPSTGPTTIEPAEFGFPEDDDDLSASFDPPADLTDWAETADASVRLMPPEAAEPAPEAPSPAEEAPGEAVFQDMPEPMASPLDVPVSDTLASKMPPADAAWAPDPPGSPASVADELDSLIASLETAPRIRPDAAFAGPAVRVTEADVDAMASETLARIYAAQHQYVRAALVYETLAAREPARADEMLAQAAEMRRRG